MVERLKALLERFLEFWNRYTSKQKTVIICVAAAVIFTLAVVFAVFSRTQYTQLEIFETTADAAEAKKLLEENGIAVRASGDNATVISVDKKKVSDAKLLLGENGVTAAAKGDYTWVTNNSMSTTDSERKLKEKLYYEDEMERVLKSITGVKTADVTIYVPDSTNTIYKDDKQSTISIMLYTTDEFTKDASRLASYAANTVGTTVEYVRILDQHGDLLYSGTDASASGNATNAIEIKTQVENNMANSIRNILISSGAYNDAAVSPQLQVTISPEEVHQIEYYSNDDDTDNTGPMTSLYTYEAENMEGLEGVVGTDANGITDVDLLDGLNSNGTVAVNRKEYATSSRETTKTTQIGEVNLNASNLAVVLSRYVMYNEEEMEEQGLLQDTTFAAFKAENSAPVVTEVDENILNLVAKASGIPLENISVMAYDVPIFYEKPASSWTFERILQLILAALVVGLIMFVVFKGMKPVEVVELEPELSVEALLATTKENQTLDDIEFSDGSATRMQIEKFVNENPEAVAALLRNWLNDDWE